MSVTETCGRPVTGTGHRLHGVAGAASLVTILVLAGCGGPPPPVTAQPAPSGPPLGIDMARDASDVLNQLKGSHLAFVARYYRDPTSRWPALSQNEAQRLSSIGMNIVAVWETHSHRPEFFSYASGYNDALAAYSQARAVGQPPGSAIYFAVDFDARHEVLAAVEDYFRGAGAGLAAAGGGRSRYQVGVYGSGTVCGAIKSAGLARYAWLTNSNAWSGTANYDDWDIRQTSGWTDLAFDNDGDEARDDYGGFRLANDQIPPPDAAFSTAQAQQTAAPSVQAQPEQAAAPIVQQPEQTATPAAAPAAPADASETETAQRQEPPPWLTAIRQAFAL